MRARNLDEVVFMPEMQPRGKNRVTGITQRIALIEQVISEFAGLRVMRLVSKQFTVTQTLPEIQRIFKDSRLTLLVGSDIARTLLYRWEGLDTLLASVSLAIGMRSGDGRDEITSVMDQLARDYRMPVDYTLIFAPEADIASTHVRSGAVQASRLHPGTLAYLQEL